MQKYVEAYQYDSSHDSMSSDIEDRHSENESDNELSARKHILYRKGRTSLISIMIFTVVAYTIILFVSMFSTSPKQIFSDVKLQNIYKASSSEYSLSIEAYNPYYRNLSSSNYLPWQFIIEPYRDYILNVTSFVIEGQSLIDDLIHDESKYAVLWDLSRTGYKYHGPSVEVNVNTVGVYEDCTVTIFDFSSEVEYSFTFTLAVKYVRREFRSLNNGDKETFINTLRLLYSLNNTIGKALYGNKYESAESLLYYHLNGAGRTDCDHWHDGAGFITKHLAFTLLAEQSLQAVNPTISMPYWEYAADASLYDHYYESPLFDDDSFGMASPLTSDHSLSDSEWKDATLPDGSSYSSWDIKSEKSLNPFVNAYGVMRSPWNNNPSHYIGRHNSTYGHNADVMPDCAAMASCYASDSYAKMADCLNGNTHGPIHIQVGGGWDTSNRLEDTNVSFLKSFSRLLYFKLLWRNGFTRCPTDCQESNAEECTCAVPDEYIETYGAQAILQKSGIWDFISDDVEGMDDAMILKVLRAVENPGIIGEMFSSAAAYDPLFWPLHGQLERLLSLKRLRVSNGIIESNAFNETWAWNHDRVAPYLHGRCDWSAVKDVADLTLPSCSYDDVCEGHNADDDLEFSNFLGTGDTYTNTEFYDFIHPWNEELPYIYDAYDFDYCMDLERLSF